MRLGKIASRQKPMQPDPGETADKVHHDEAQGARCQFDRRPDGRQEEHVAEQVEQVRVKEQGRKDALEGGPHRIEAEVVDQVGLPDEDECRGKVRDNEDQSGNRKAAGVQGRGPATVTKFGTAHPFRGDWARESGRASAGSSPPLRGPGP